MLCMAFCAKAQNFSPQTRFLDNWDFSFQTGLLLPVSGKSFTSPTFTLTADKWLTPWLGAGADFRNSIATPGYRNPHTAFDDFNLSAVGKVNIGNLFSSPDGRRLFEDIPYASVGWGHKYCGHRSNPNYMTARFGNEFVLNLGERKAWALVINPSFTWEGVRGLKLKKQNCYFECGIGILFHGKNSNDTHAWSRFKEEPPLIYETIKEVPVEKEVTKRVVTVLKDTYVVFFAAGSANITTTSELDKIPAGTTVDITAYASPEGNARKNNELSQARAYQVAKYLSGRGVKTRDVVAKGAESETSNRVAIVKIVQ